MYKKLVMVLWVMPACAGGDFWNLGGQRPGAAAPGLEQRVQELEKQVARQEGMLEAQAAMMQQQARALAVLQAAHTVAEQAYSSVGVRELSVQTSSVSSAIFQLPPRDLDEQQGAAAELVHVRVPAARREDSSDDELVRVPDNYLSANNNKPNSNNNRS